MDEMRLESPNAELQAKLHLPRAHEQHGGRSCGCATPRPGCFVCRKCGACYDIEEVWEFPVWRCYDCSARYLVAQEARLLRSGQVAAIERAKERAR
jgi:hypothetical protein